MATDREHYLRRAQEARELAAMVSDASTRDALIHAAEQLELAAFNSEDAISAPSVRFC